MPEKKPDPSIPHDPWAAFRYRDFTVLQGSRLLNIIAFQMTGVVLGWDVYTHTKSPLNLGLIGLFQFVPSIAFALLTGLAADRCSRRNLIQGCQSVMTVCILLLLLCSRDGYAHMGLVYAVLFLIGTARAFQAPAAQAMMPQLVPKRDFSSAVAWNNSVFNISTIAGPSMGGVLYGFAHRAAPVYIVAAVMMGLAFGLTALITNIRPAQGESKYSWDSLLAGIRFVFDRRLVLGAISLDLFAVLLGGATALLPIFANDRLLLHGHPVGSTGLGFLRASFALGAVTMGFAVAHMRPLKQAGKMMFLSVAAFGVFTVCFGLSTNYWFSLFCLFTLGAVDMISVVVRHTMVQLATPDAMRGRVSAVNMIFIGASNELGEFESGVTAQWWGVVPAVVIGGIGTLIVTVVWAWRFPELRRFQRLDGSTENTEVKAQDTGVTEEREKQAAL